MDPLLQAIVEAPDDDAPRLVWADREGGERGELVVLQCAIAARQGTREDRVRMQARVRELLPRFTPYDVQFERGFAERVHTGVHNMTPELFERLPTARTLVLDDAGSNDLATALAKIPRGRLRTLQASAESYANPSDQDDNRLLGDGVIAVIASAPSLAGLERLRIHAGAYTEAAAPHLAAIGVDSIRGGTAMGGRACVEMLRNAPRMSRFGPWHGKRLLKGNELLPILAAPELLQLRTFDLWANEIDDDDLLRLSYVRFQRLDTLGIGWSNATQVGLDALASSKHLAGLTELDMYHTDSPTTSPVAFLRPPFAIRRLRLGRIDDAIIDELVQAPALEELHVHVPTDEQLARLRAAIPLVNESETW